MQVVGGGSGAAYPGGVSYQHQEGGLEGVLGGVRVGHQLTTHRPYHRPVPADQLGERRLFAGDGEPV